MTVGDWSVKIWNEESKSQIIRTRYHNSYLSGGCWSPTRPGLFFVTRRDGWLDAWDYFYRQNEISFSHKVSDSAFTSLKIYSGQNAGFGSVSNPDGRLAAVGDQDGTVTLLELCESLYLGTVLERDSIGDMFARETQKEKYLDAMKKAADQNKGKQRENKALAQWEEKKPTVVKKCEDEFFAKMEKYKDALIDEGEKSDDEGEHKKKKDDKKPDEKPKDEKKPDEKKPEEKPKEEKPDETKPEGGQSHDPKAEGGHH